MARTTKKKAEPITIQCTSCGGIKRSSDFYKSFSVIYKSSIESRATICKECVALIFDGYLNKYEDTRKAIYMTCRKLDICYLNILYESAVTQCANYNLDSVFRFYIQKISSLPQYRNKTFDDSDEIEGLIKETKMIQASDEEAQAMLDRKNELIKVWGKNSTYALDDYEWLENFYFEYTQTYDTSTPTQRNLYRNIAKVHLQAEKELSTGNVKNYNDLLKLSSQLHTDGNIKPVQKLGMNDNEGIGTYGLWIKHIENDEPCEYFKDKPLYEDYDGLRKYFEEWIIRPLKNIFDVGDKR